MGGVANGLGAALGGYAQSQFGVPVNPTSTAGMQQQNAAQNRMKRGGIINAVTQGINRYKAAQQQAQAPPSSPANSMDMSPVANPAMTPPAQGSMAPSNQTAGYADEVGGGDGEPMMSAQSSNSYNAVGGGQGAAMADSAVCATAWMACSERAVSACRGSLSHPVIVPWNPAARSARPVEEPSRPVPRMRTRSIIPSCVHSASVP